MGVESRYTLSKLYLQFKLLYTLKTVLIENIHQRHQISKIWQHPDSRGVLAVEMSYNI